MVARSSAEAEFRVVAQGICEFGLKHLVEELGVKVETPMKLYNKAAISISHNPVQHNRTKHVEINRHFIKEKSREWNDLHVVCTIKGSISIFIYQRVAKANIRRIS